MPNFALNFPIDTIIFDLDGTLRHSVPSSDRVQYQFVLQLGVADQPGRQVSGTRWVHYYWAQSPELLQDIDKFGNDLKNGFWTNYSHRYLKSIGLTEKRAAAMAKPLQDLMDQGYKPENQVHADVPETLHNLRESGFTLGLVSNRTRSCHEECESLGLLSYFDFAYVAGEVDLWKPDPRIFDRAFEICGSTPEKTIYIGDNYFADILGAKNAGIQPILLDPTAIFPEAECTVIRSIDELLTVLG